MHDKILGRIIFKNNLRAPIDIVYIDRHDEHDFIVVLTDNETIYIQYKGAFYASFTTKYDTTDYILVRDIEKFEIFNT